MKKKLLIIEDEKSVAKQLRWGLGEEYEVTIASTVEQARPLLRSGAFPVVTLDLGLPPSPSTPEQGFALLEEISSMSPPVQVLVITGNAEEGNAIKAIGLGASDFYAKPIDLKILKIILAKTYRTYELEEAYRQLEEQGRRSGSLCGMIGVSQVMVDVFDRIKRAAKTDYPVLVTGSTGTGKEMAARALHDLSGRAKQPFVIINCGAIPENLIESELFGHEKGAFTGASRRQLGKFEQADGGTILLDEIGELPLPSQVKLLRVIQESTIDRLGGRETISVDVRIIAATNVDLERAAEKKEFRQDLLYRLNVVPIRMPDLSERTEDVLILAHKILQVDAKILGRGQVSFSPGTLGALVGCRWPGNVRELQNRIRRALATTSGKVLHPGDLDLAEPSSVEKEEKFYTLKKAREMAERKAVQQALGLTGNNISQAAKLLEISRPTLHDLLKKHGTLLC
ncbi:MAG: PEP-CTERM-box response regulator transcription factor [Desulfotalea sp.]|nr:MAG: PEP-CTERM-box response regulator transcription factor [Desulfotalea sp.]